MSSLNLTDGERELYQERLINFTAYSQKVRMANKKKQQKIFEITCNQGSVSGGGIGGDMKITMMAVNIEAARKRFELDETNQRYGRQIKSIREV